ncbi:RNA polymerase sigma factor [Clostridium sp. AM58-1XD]|uniref:RNA polymerase sigma factor n=1 Tax=Clostridium sp. AM58-1XD TaxID=2292307 RepID=UPI000E556930|nr:RNA polymerase sigma factor [Clostridium sp. AM58-1XD]RGY97469.1 RNA polymerase sigma factor [Clostridium sp. AM58-1XD]
MEQKANEIFRSMYEDYKIQLRTIARHYGIPYDEIDDEIQETFTSYYENYSVDNEKSGCILVTILRNRCIDYRRKIHYETVSADSDAGRFAIDEITSGFGRDTADKVAELELYEKVRTCISEMRSEWQEVILYCCILQYTSEETGDILGISSIACRSRLLRAREHLRKKMKNYF